MKKKEEFTKLFRSPLVYLYILIAIVWTVCFINSEFCRLYPDSGSYIYWSFENWSYGYMARTPVYPVIIEIFEILLRDNYLYGVVILQIVFSLVSVYYLYSIVMLIANMKENMRCAKIIAFVICLLYALNPSVYQFQPIILTESFALSFSIIFIFYAIKFLKNNAVRDGFLLLFWTYLCTMLKPGMIIYYIDVVILLAVMYVRNSELRINLRKIGIGVLFLAVLYAAYMGEVYHVSGVFSMSSQGPRHDLVKIIDSGLYKNYYDENIIFEIDAIREETNYSLDYDMSTPVMRLIADSDDFITQNQRVAEFNNYCLRTDPARYFKYLIEVCVKNTLEVSLHSEGYRGVILRNRTIYLFERIITPIFKILNVAQAYMIGLISLFIGLLQFVKNKNFLLLCLGGGIFSILLSVTMGTYSEWSRTMVYVLPFVYVGIAALLIYPSSGHIIRNGSKSDIPTEPKCP